jgi:DNA polymerase-3 subunit delta'
VIELPGQPLAERVLRAALAREDPPQQLLFHGPPGTGKREAARRVAWELVDPGREHGPGERSLDVSIVRGTGHMIRLEELEPALADLASRPAVGPRRALIIEEAERLYELTGAPRLLKPLEEPPSRSHIILVTDRVVDVLPTVRSRCLPVPFRHPGWRAVAERLEAEGVPAEEARGLARASGPAALATGSFDRRARAIGVELALRALIEHGDRGSVIRDVQRAIEDEARRHPSPELEALRAEAAALSGKRGARTAERRADDQERRELRRAVSDGWALVLDGAAGLVADALAVCVGAESTVRHREHLEELRTVAVPARQAFLERAAEEIALTRSELALNPSVDLAVEALLIRLDAARQGTAGPLVAPGRLPF